MTSMTTTAPEALDHRLLQQHNYALVAAEHRDQLASDISTTSIARGALSDSAELMPCLVSLDQLNQKQRSALMIEIEEAHAVGEPPVISALLNSDASAQRIESHIASIQLRIGPAGERAWLRVHDPRVWLHLPRVFVDRDMNMLFGPIKKWSVYIAGRWVVTHPPHKTHPRSNRHPTATAQWAALERIGVINRVLARNGWLTHEDLVERSTAIDELVLRARANHGLQSVADLVAFATLGSIVHPRFDESAVALCVIGEHERERRNADADDGSSVIDALQAISKEQWVLAKRELDAANNKEATP